MDKDNQHTLSPETVEEKTQDEPLGRDDRGSGMFQEGEIDRTEPLVLFHLTSASLTPQPLALILAQQLPDQALAQRRRGRVFGEDRFVPDDVGKGRVPVGSFERCTPVLRE